MEFSGSRPLLMNINLNMTDSFLSMKVNKFHMLFIINKTELLITYYYLFQVVTLIYKVMVSDLKSEYLFIIHSGIVTSLALLA